MSFVFLDSVAWGIVDGAAGNLLFGRGATTSRSGAGRYMICLLPGFELDNNEMMVTAIPAVDAPRATIFRRAGSSDTNKNVRIYNTVTGVSTDTDFYFKIERLRIL